MCKERDQAAAQAQAAKTQAQQAEDNARKAQAAQESAARHAASLTARVQTVQGHQDLKYQNLEADHLRKQAESNRRHEAEAAALQHQMLEYEKKVQAQTQAAIQEAEERARRAQVLLHQ